MAMIEIIKLPSGDFCSVKNNLSIIREFDMDIAVVHKTNANHRYRPVSKCDVDLRDNLDGRSFYWSEVTCPDCLRFRGSIERKMIGKGKTINGMVK